MPEKCRRPELAEARHAANLNNRKEFITGRNACEPIRTVFEAAKGRKGSGLATECSTRDINKSKNVVLGMERIERKYDRAVGPNAIRLRPMSRETLNLDRKFIKAV